MPSRSIDPVSPTDVLASVAGLAAGKGDPTIAVEDDAAWLATRTPEGPATARFSGTATVEVEAFGPGANEMLERAPGIVGAEDPGDFRTDHPLIGRLLRRHPGLRTTRTGAITEGLLRIIPAQRVTSRQAHRSYRVMTEELGEPAPGPRSLLLPPDPEALARLGYPAFHRWGIERSRATTMIRVARAARRLEEAAAMPLEDAYRRITAVRGVGPWSAGKIGFTALGDPDAVPVGDYHLPNSVAYALAGEPRADDDRMLDLLEPFRPHRGRVVQLIKAAHISAPKYGPRTEIRSIEHS